MNSVILSTENISASYGKKEVLRNVSVKINTGEIVALVGPNGAGKSTLLKTIIGLLLPKTGKIIFERKDITLLAPDTRANLGIGYLFQGGAVFTNLTVLQNLDLSIANLKIKDNDRIEKVFSFFPEIKEKSSQRAGLLSGGLKQMLSFAMILIRQPKILLLDEPSAGLAPALVETMAQRIKEINQKEKTTILLIEQNIRKALQIAHRAYLMKSGKIVKETDTPMELLKKEYFEKIFFE